MKNKKPKLSIDDQIIHLKKKGITFNILSEDDAKEYLTENNNYFKLTSYRKNFIKYQFGEKIGQYINLDFSYLKDLAIIDMRIRYLFLHLSLDIEHSTKLSLLKKIDLYKEDGYSIVNEFIDSNNETQKNAIHNELDRNMGNTYCGAIISKYNDSYPIWAFIEILPFGRLLSFYKFCADKFDDKSMADNYYRLLTCKELRNACAHNNCIINELFPNSPKHKTNFDVSKSIMKIPGISPQTRLTKMNNSHIQQIVTLLYMHKTLVLSEGIQKHCCEELSLLTKRMYKNIDFYSENITILTSFDFLKKIIDFWCTI